MYNSEHKQSQWRQHPGSAGRPEHHLRVAAQAWLKSQEEGRVQE